MTPTPQPPAETSTAPAPAGASPPAEDRFRLAFVHAPIGKAVVALDGTWLEVNRALCTLLGYSEEELLSRSFQDITHPDDLELDISFVERMLRGELSRYEMDKRYLTAAGDAVWTHLTVGIVRDDAGAPRFFISQIQDITGRKEHEAELRHLADHDPLTGLPNRRRFTEELERQLLLSARHAVPASLLLLDLDRFKAVNDDLGHAVGDELLRRVGDALRGRRRRSDVAARLGGDEFALLLPHTRGEEAEVAAALLAEQIGAITVGPPHRACRARASIGVAELVDGATSDEVLAAADRAMYAVKRGRS